MATAPEQINKRRAARTDEPDTEAIQSFFEASAEAAREYLAVTNAAALDGLRKAFAAQNEGLKAWTQAVQAGQTAATKIAVAGAKLVEDSNSPNSSFATWPRRVVKTALDLGSGTDAHRARGRGPSTSRDE